MLNCDAFMPRPFLATSAKFHPSPYLLMKNSLIVEYYLAHNEKASMEEQKNRKQFSPSLIHVDARAFYSITFFK